MPSEVNSGDNSQSEMVEGIVRFKSLFTHTSRGRAAVARRAHNPKVTSSILVLATTNVLNRLTNLRKKNLKKILQIQKLFLSLSYN